MKERSSVAVIARMAVITLLLCVCTSAVAAKHPRKSSEQLRTEYLASVAEAPMNSADARQVGSLWSPGGMLNDPSADYKARGLNDSITILAAVQTTAAQSGSVNNQRNFSTTSAITGVAGGVSTAYANPLLAANSDAALKGQGQTSSNTTFSTSLTGRVIAVLPHGELVVEAHRQIDMNNQHEEVVVRGVARPGDISPGNTIASNELSSLEVELKGKGIISDSVRQPNPVTRAVLRVIGF